jgi:hypothetical protein
MVWGGQLLPSAREGLQAGVDRIILIPRAFGLPCPTGNVVFLRRALLFASSISLILRIPDLGNLTHAFRECLRYF